MAVKPSEAHPSSSVPRYRERAPPDVSVDLDAFESDVDEQGDDDTLELRQPTLLDRNHSSMSMASSQMSGCSDIDEIIRQAPLFGTQGGSSTPESVPSSVTPSVSSLGKRKASELSGSSLASSSRLPKLSKTDSAMEDDHCKAKVIKIETEADASREDDRPETDDNDPKAEKPFLISHHLGLEQCFDARKLPYGVRFEIHRLFTKCGLKFADILMEDLDKLRQMGPNARAAPLTGSILLDRGQATKQDHNTQSELAVAQMMLIDETVKSAFAKEISARSPWKELDTEEEMLEKDPFSGLGFSKLMPDWYGGKIQFRATLSEITPGQKNSKFKITLEPAELGPSCRFTRRFGSKNFLRIKIPKHLLHKRQNKLNEFFKKPFVLGIDVLRVYCIKDTNVFLVKTNEVYYNGAIRPSPKSGTGMSVDRFRDWHNNLNFNCHQPMNKFCSRTSLGLSNSVPALKLPIDRICYIEDIVSASGSEMTDGCGWINKAGLRQIHHQFQWSTWPTAIQCRVAGAKGLLLQHPDDDDDEARIWLRPSQIKIKYPDDEEPDPAMCIVDLLRSAHLKSPCRLSVETIINLADNGVPSSAFVSLLREGLKAVVTPLLAWEGRDAMTALRVTVARMGGIMSARQARQMPGEARVNGYGDRDSEEVENEDEDGLESIDDALKQKSAAWWGDRISGQPSSIEETVVSLLDSGFTPQNCAVLRDKLQKLIKGYVKNYVRAYRIEVPMSATAFIVPDASGLLEPGEIYFKSSQRCFKTPDGLDTDLLLGDALITRHPCKLPTDVQKWTAVDRPEFRHFTDVIIMSTKGPRRAADYLAGGDYDGDKCLVISQPELVEPFNNAPLEFSEEPKGIHENFLKENENVSDFLERIRAMTSIEKIHAYQDVVLNPLRDTSVVGQYSTFHEHALYTLGLRHPDTIRLAFLFCMILDGAKTGLKIRPDILSADIKKWNKRPPKWKESDEDKEKVGNGRANQNQNNLERPSNLPRFIMDTIYEQSKKEGDRIIGQIEATFKTTEPANPVDPHLTAPWLAQKALAQRWKTEMKSDRKELDLKRIADHVHEIYEEHASQVKIKGSTKGTKGGSAFTNLPIQDRQDTIRALSRKFVSMPPPDELMMLGPEIASTKASYAYLYGSERASQKWCRFPWDVALRELCAIKAAALGTTKTVPEDIYEAFYMKDRSSRH